MPNPDWSKGVPQPTPGEYRQTIVPMPDTSRKDPGQRNGETETRTPMPSPWTQRPTPGSR